MRTVNVYTYEYIIQIVSLCLASSLDCAFGVSWAHFGKLWKALGLLWNSLGCFGELLRFLFDLDDLHFPNKWASSLQASHRIRPPGFNPRIRPSRQVAQGLQVPTTLHSHWGPGWHELWQPLDLGLFSTFKGYTLRNWILFWILKGIPFKSGKKTQI